MLEEMTQLKKHRFLKQQPMRSTTLGVFVMVTGERRNQPLKIIVHAFQDFKKLPTKNSLSKNLKALQKFRETNLSKFKSNKPFRIFLPHTEMSLFNCLMTTGTGGYIRKLSLMQRVRWWRDDKSALSKWNKGWKLFCSGWKLMRNLEPTQARSHGEGGFGDSALKNFVAPRKNVF